MATAKIKLQLSTNCMLYPSSHLPPHILLWAPNIPRISASGALQLPRRRHSEKAGDVVGDGGGATESASQANKIGNNRRRTWEEANGEPQRGAESKPKDREEKATMVYQRWLEERYMSFIDVLLGWIAEEDDFHRQVRARVCAPLCAGSSGVLVQYSSPVHDQGMIFSELCFTMEFTSVSQLERRERR